MDREAIEAMIREKMPAPVLQMGWRSPDICWVQLDVRNAEGEALSVCLVKSDMDDAGIETRVGVMRATVAAWPIR